MSKIKNYPKKWRGSVLSNVLQHSAFILAAAPAGAVEDLPLAVVGLGVVNRRLNFNVFKKTAAVPSLTSLRRRSGTNRQFQGLCLFY